MVYQDDCIMEARRILPTIATLCVLVYSLFLLAALEVMTAFRDELEPREERASLMNYLPVSFYECEEDITADEGEEEVNWRERRPANGGPTREAWDFSSQDFASFDSKQKSVSRGNRSRATLRNESLL